MESWSTRSRRRKPPESIYTPLDMSSPPEPYLTMGQGRSRFRVEDLLQLAERLQDRTDPEDNHVK